MERARKERNIDMDRFQAEGNTLIRRSPDDVFKFLCYPDVDPADLTPMEDRVVEWQEMQGVGALSRMTIELAARELDCVCRCTEFEPPHRLATRLEGDLEGTQTWRLASENGGTRLHLSLDIARPEWTPAYLRDEQVAKNWGQTLVDQTLENVKAALESESA